MVFDERELYATWLRFCVFRLEITGPVIENLLKVLILVFLPWVCIRTGKCRDMDCTSVLQRVAETLTHSSPLISFNVERDDNLASLNGPNGFLLILDLAFPANYFSFSSEHALVALNHEKGHCVEEI